MNLKKTLVAIAAVATFSSAAVAEKLSVAATPVPHAELLEFVKPALAEQGVELDVKVFTDYVQPNIQVDQKRMDANFFQHQPYLDEFNSGRGTNLVTVAGIHVEPFGAYSSKISSLDELKDRAVVAIPNDPTNGGRALLLLQEAGLITLKDESKITATPRDIADNPKRLNFRELEAATLPRILNQVDMALINTNYALEAGLNPSEDAMVIEGAESPYVNILVARPDNKDSDAMQKLANALKSDAVREFIKEKYEGAVVPAF
ncbi:MULTISPECIES: MetQ/NlpA family ABC transporter substrate-binding protein [Marinobacter]|jgi:D-methionine transport system substrate-binding protein|uniref:Methionine ABC transporter substrate-binding protein n=3 Tax=Marinobacter TaxID=2742 RepID=A0A137SE50_9GAMM|nr:MULTISPECIES: MetQ/NlpA family ABC transporter substrate-binding protein [Marinobacter]MDX5442039.1 MetQ/NlpA family ABC transporter substrate-binding protein [Alteromonadaceae bacterium]PKM04574.1 MAG: methionine ABC transporter substrate-binding protein [Gammaproteobacteria bacterium HGW-Gammaproteobacteria-6]WBU41503.1 MetQ/NlpA family ABC transporter substrate-binding protein [Marinobacter alkaliphilus]AMQ88973.1 methionine ABC transporter substrate-binding protein [Marinobacter sp. LQ44